MCGIVGAVSRRNIVPVLVQGLQRLEYRGYDSCGLAIHGASAASVAGNASKGLTRARSTARVDRRTIGIERSVNGDGGGLGIRNGDRVAIGQRQRTATVVPGAPTATGRHEPRKRVVGGLRDAACEKHGNRRQAGHQGSHQSHITPLMDTRSSAPPHRAPDIY